MHAWIIEKKTLPNFCNHETSQYFWAGSLFICLLSQKVWDQTEHLHKIQLDKLEKFIYSLCFNLRIHLSSF